MWLIRPEELESARYLTEVEEDVQVFALVPPSAKGHIVTSPLGSMRRIFVTEYPTDERDLLRFLRRIRPACRVQVLPAALVELSDILSDACYETVAEDAEAAGVVRIRAEGIRSAPSSFGIPLSSLLALPTGLWPTAAAVELIEVLMSLLNSPLAAECAQSATGGAWRCLAPIIDDAGLEIINGEAIIGEQCGITSEWCTYQGSTVEEAADRLEPQQMHMSASSLQRAEQIICAVEGSLSLDNLRPSRRRLRENSYDDPELGEILQLLNGESSSYGSGPYDEGDVTGSDWLSTTDDGFLGAREFEEYGSAEEDDADYEGFYSFDEPIDTRKDLKKRKWRSSEEKEGGGRAIEERFGAEGLNQFEADFEKASEGLRKGSVETRLIALVTQEANAAASVLSGTISESGGKAAILVSSTPIMTHESSETVAGDGDVSILKIKHTADWMGLLTQAWSQSRLDTLFIGFKELFNMWVAEAGRALLAGRKRSSCLEASEALMRVVGSLARSTNELILEVPASSALIELVQQALGARYLPCIDVTWRNASRILSMESYHTRISSDCDFGGGSLTSLVHLVLNRTERTTPGIIPLRFLPHIEGFTSDRVMNSLKTLAETDGDHALERGYLRWMTESESTTFLDGVGMKMRDKDYDFTQVPKTSHKKSKSWWLRDDDRGEESTRNARQSFKAGPRGLGMIASLGRGEDLKVRGVIGHTILEHRLNQIIKRQEATKMVRLMNTLPPGILDDGRFSFVEWGSGEGQLSMAIAEAFPNATVISVEPNAVLSKKHNEVLQTPSNVSFEEESFSLKNNIACIGDVNEDVAQDLADCPELFRFQWVGERQQSAKLGGLFSSSALTTFIPLQGGTAVSLLLSLLTGRPISEAQLITSKFLNRYAARFIAPHVSSDTTLECSWLGDSPASGVVQCDVISSYRQVHHHFKWYKDGHKRTYTMNILPVSAGLVRSSGIAMSVKKPDWRRPVSLRYGIDIDNFYVVGGTTRTRAINVTLFRDKDNSPIPYISPLRAVTLIFIMRLGLSSEVKEALYREFLSLPLYEDMAPWNIVAVANRLDYIDFDSRGKTFTKAVQQAYMALTILANYKRTVEDFGHCDRKKAKITAGYDFFPYIHDCVGNSKFKGPCKSPEFPVPCSDGKCHPDMISCLRARAGVSEKVLVG
ncbi:hypothetical protein FOZ61_003162 [Perkinsus olseni]|uniref:Uncharacterized protein n=1 Tax=Perkinsus olseni TaxID=32597 RepID=A0A7J6LQ90_PEROL|nr:hypothetical protein FOZ61_003162 [Perkinsus olseni]